MTSRGGLEVVPAQAHNLNDASASLAPATTSPTWNHADYLKKENAAKALMRLLFLLRIKSIPEYMADRTYHEFLHRQIGKILKNGR